MNRILAFRARWAGTIQDVISGVVMLVFLFSAGFWLAVLA